MYGKYLLKIHLTREGQELFPKNSCMPFRLFDIHKSHYQSCKHTEGEKSGSRCIRDSISYLTFSVCALLGHSAQRHFPFAQVHPVPFGPQALVKQKVLVKLVNAIYLNHVRAHVLAGAFVDHFEDDFFLCYWVGQRDWNLHSDLLYLQGSDVNILHFT